MSEELLSHSVVYIWLTMLGDYSRVALKFPIRLLLFR